MIIALLVGVVWVRRRKVRREMAVHARLFERWVGSFLLTIDYLPLGIALEYTLLPTSFYGLGSATFPSFQVILSSPT